jgi:nucleotide-binding universal stress UspA family protein
VLIIISIEMVTIPIFPISKTFLGFFRYTLGELELWNIMLKSDYIQALDDYRRARRSADIQELLSRFRGSTEELELLSYDEVRQQLRAVEKSSERLTEIPLDKIVGSVGRYHDFTRRFLPKNSIDQNRWARVMATTKGLSGLPPIDVYRLGEVYFVRDGNHRVSVARQMGNTSIQAYVTDVESKVNLTPDIKPDDLIIKSEQVKFLEQTQLDRTKPNADLAATKPGAYPTLIEHIRVHRHYMGIERQREITFEEAAAHWYDEVFSPVINIIRKRDLLREFPDRTAVDLYLWAADHKAKLATHIGWEIGTEAALSDIKEKHSPKFGTSVRNLISQLVEILTPDVIEDGPPPGTWRRRLFDMTIREYLFSDLIVALDDSDNVWNALDQAINLAKAENSRIHGLHIHKRITESSQEEHQDIQSDFSQRCKTAGIKDHDFLIAEGNIGEVLCQHARFADLIVFPLNHPPGEKPIIRLGSGITTLIRSCPVPILAVPSTPTQMKHILLAYDGSNKSKEAMHIAAYLGSQHNISLKVLTSGIGINHPHQIQKECQEYLDRFPIETEYIISDSTVVKEIKGFQDRGDIDMVIIGGYGYRSLVNLVLGSVVDEVLREIQLPILICR